MDEDYLADLDGEAEYRRLHTPRMKSGGHLFDEDCICIHCGFDGAEHWHWRTQTYEGRAAALNGKADEPPCSAFKQNSL